MRTVSTIFWALVAVCLVVVGLANRGIVRLRVLPEALGNFAGVSPDVDLPLFMVVLVGFALGLLVGFVWEWLREVPERAAARDAAREIDRLRAEVARLRGEASRRGGGGRDDVLAVLDPAPVPARR